MTYLSRRERRDLNELGRRLAAQDPSLAEQLSGPAPRRRDVWASRIGSVMMVLGLVMPASGFLFDSSGVGAFGVVMLLTCWMPARIAESPDPASP